MCPLFHPHPPSSRRAWGPVYPYQGESKVHSLHKEGPGPCPSQPRWLWNAFSPPEGGLDLGPPYLGRCGVPYLCQEGLGSHSIPTGVSLVSTLSARRTHLVSHHCSRCRYPSLCQEIMGSHLSKPWQLWVPFPLPAGLRAPSFPDEVGAEFPPSTRSA